MDTKPARQRPPAHYIEAAAKAIPAELANSRDGVSALAANIWRGLEKQDHGLAAVCWAIHRLVTEGKLHAELASGYTSAGSLPNPEPTRQEWIEVRRLPPPLNARVTATDELWAWWQEAAELESTPTPSRLAGEGSAPQQFAPGKLEQALALLVSRPEITDTEVADAVGVCRTTLYKRAWKPFQDARAAMRASPKAGYYENGRIEAIDDV